jgi:hypothetical protein
VLVTASFTVYWLFNRRREPLHDLVTQLDRKVPFIPAFSIPYLTHFPYLFGVTLYGILFSPHFAAMSLSALIIQAVTAAFYRFYQTHVPRPKDIGKGWTSRLVAFIYWSDEPYNTFPSQHVAYSLFCLYWSWFLFPDWFPFFALLTAAIIASTQFLKQHVLADALGGALLTALALLIGRLVF